MQLALQISKKQELKENRKVSRLVFFSRDICVKPFAAFKVQLAEDLIIHFAFLVIHSLNKKLLFANLSNFSSGYKLHAIYCQSMIQNFVQSARRIVESLIQKK